MTLTLDASGTVPVQVTPASHQNVGWIDLDAFAQGYVEAALRDADKELRHGIAVGDLAGSTQDNQLRTLGFRHLAPDTLAAMMADCATIIKRTGWADLRESVGREAWRLRQASTFFYGLRPITLYLGEDGLIHHREAS